MRLFIAIRLSDEMKKALINCMHDLKKQGVEGNYAPAQNLHMTLAFIGEYDDPESVCKETVSGPSGESGHDGKEGFPYEVGAEEWKNGISGALN